MLHEIYSEEGFVLGRSYRVVTAESRHLTPGIVLLHGSASPGGKGRVLFKSLQEYLGSNGVSSIALDNTGVGLSCGDYQDSTLDMRVVEGGIAYRKLRYFPVDPCRIAVLGTSMGGHIASELVRLHPDWFNKVIIVGGAAYSENAKNKRLKPSTEFTDTIRSEKGWENTPVSRAFEHFLGRVLRVNCEFDTTVPDEVRDVYRRAVGDKGEEFILKGLPHTIFSATDPNIIKVREEVLYPEILRFLRS